MKDRYEKGQIVYDTMANIKAIVRGIENGLVKLSSLDRPDTFYYQVPYRVQ